jgi:hypothetical protein
VGGRELFADIATELDDLIVLRSAAGQQIGWGIPPSREVAESMGLRALQVGRHVRFVDAEFKLLGYLLRETDQAASGILYIGASRPYCPSCIANMWRAMAQRPGINIIPVDPVFPYLKAFLVAAPTAGAASAAD